jgi:hypothetical protein
MTLWFEACEIQGSKSIAFESPGHFVKRSEFSLLVHDFLNKEDVFLSNFVFFLSLSETDFVFFPSVNMETSQG